MAADVAQQQYNNNEYYALIFKYIYIYIDDVRDAKSWRTQMKSPLKFGSAYVMQDLHWFTSFFNKILTINKMSSKWLRSTLISIYKNKRDIQNCINYHEIKLMSHAMKL